MALSHSLTNAFGDKILTPNLINPYQITISLSDTNPSASLQNSNCRLPFRGRYGKLHPRFLAIFNTSYLIRCPYVQPICNHGLINDCFYDSKTLVSKIRSQRFISVL